LCRFKSSLTLRFLIWCAELCGLAEYDAYKRFIEQKSNFLEGNNKEIKCFSQMISMLRVVLRDAFARQNKTFPMLLQNY
jgi:hypothetical protein